MRVLIIGCGYIGTGVAETLAGEGHQVYALRRTAGQAEVTSAGAFPVYGDVTKPETLKQLDSAYDWVVNCVSAGGGGAEEYREVYLKGMQNIAAWLHETPPRRFIYTSSTSVYGQIDGSLVDETSPAEPLAETSRILIQTEDLLLEAGRKFNFAAMILRLAGIYGPGRGYWQTQFTEGQARIEAGGQRWLNMVHRDDAIGAIVTALARGKSGQIYNVVDDEPVQQLSLFQWLAQRFNRPLPPETEASALVTRKRGATNKRVSNRKLKQELGYQFKYPTFREGMTQA